MIDCLRLLYETQRGGVHAVAETGGLGAVVEDVAEVRVTFCARDGGADHTERNVANLSNIFPGDRLPEARPSGAGIEFGAGVEERIVAADAAVDAFVVEVPVLPGKGHLGVGAACDVECVFGKLFAPIVFGLHDFGDADLFEALAVVGEEDDGDIFRLSRRDGRSLKDCGLSPLPEREARESGCGCCEECTALQIG